MDDQRNRLQVSLSLPENGWIEFALSTPESEFKEAVSFVPKDFVLELATAVSLAMQGVDSVAVASCEPVTFELTFSAVTATDRTRLQIVEYSDEKRSRKSASLIWSFETSRLGMVLPFWRALRRLQTCMSTNEYASATGRDFPVACLDRLTQLVSDKHF